MNEEWNRDNSLNNLPEGTEHPGEENQKEDTIRSSESQINFTMRDSSREEEARQTSASEREDAGEQKTQYHSYHISNPVPPQEPPKKRKKAVSSGGWGKKFAVCVSFAVVFGLVAGVSFQAVNAVGNSLNGTKEKEQVKIGTTDPVGTSDSSVINTSAADTSAAGSSVKEVAKNVMPSLVAITNISVQEVPNYFGFGSQQYEGKSSGSGIIVGQNDSELLIATNNHVVDGATTLTVCFTGQEDAAAAEADSQSASSSEQDPNAVEAQIKGTDPDNDLAVIAVKLADIPEDVKSQIKIAKLGDSDALEVGDQVVAIGNALGYGQSVTSGYVSALNREVSVENVTSRLIQTDAAINPGNSGGALLNMKGEVIGINSVKFASSEVEGMGYAIPITTAEPILNELMNQETKYKVTDENKQSYLGISCKNVDSQITEMYNMPQGAFVSEVTSGGPAEAAGIKKGDIITKIEGTSVSSADALIEQLEYYEAGKTVDVTVARAENGEYKEQTLSVTLGNKSDMPSNVQQKQ